MLTPDEGGCGADSDGGGIVLFPDGGGTLFPRFHPHLVYYGFSNTFLLFQSFFFFLNQVVAGKEKAFQLASLRIIAAVTDGCLLCTRHSSKSFLYSI